MAEKKNQHLVPACYLKEFLGDIPKEHKDNSHFQKGIYVNNKLLTDKWRMRSITHPTFTKSYFYNLKGDNPKAPKVEEYLSKIENHYSKTLKLLKSGFFSNNILSLMSYFTCVQHMRVEPFIDMMQSGFDQLGKWMDDATGNNEASNELTDITKKMLMQFEHGKILHPHSAIIINSTNFPFLTSDNPVQRRQVNIDDLSTLLGEQYVKMDQRKSVEKAFFFLPLTPQIAYISCELIQDKRKGSLFILDDLSCIFWINYHGVKNAHENVYSSIVEPIKGEKQLSDFLVNEATEDSGYIAKIYTHDDRYLLPITDYNTTNEMIEFTTDDIAFRNSVTVGENISLIEIFDNGRSCRGMRECIVEFINPNVGRFNVAPKIKLGI
jgi:hypothetical protein